MNKPVPCLNRAACDQIIRREKPLVVAEVGRQRLWELAEIVRADDIAQGMRTEVSENMRVTVFNHIGRYGGAELRRLLAISGIPS